MYTNEFFPEDFLFLLFEVKNGSEAFGPTFDFNPRANISPSTFFMIVKLMHILERKQHNKTAPFFWFRRFSNIVGSCIF